MSLIGLLLAGVPAAARARASHLEGKREGEEQASALRLALLDRAEKRRRGLLDEQKTRAETAKLRREAEGPRAPIRGTPEYEAALGREEEIRGRSRARHRAPRTETGSAGARTRYIAQRVRELTRGNRIQGTKALPMNEAMAQARQEAESIFGQFSTVQSGSSSTASKASPPATRAPAKPKAPGGSAPDAALVEQRREYDEAAKALRAQGKNPAAIIGPRP